VNDLETSVVACVRLETNCPPGCACRSVATTTLFGARYLQAPEARRSVRPYGQEKLARARQHAGGGLSPDEIKVL